MDKHFLHTLASAIVFISIPDLVTTTDSSVGRAEDCRCSTGAGILRSLVQIRLGGEGICSLTRQKNSVSSQKTLSEVGFEPTPTFVDQNAP